MHIFMPQHTPTKSIKHIKQYTVMHVMWLWYDLHYEANKRLHLCVVRNASIVCMARIMSANNRAVGGID